jgi:hypothetical protein
MKEMSGPSPARQGGSQGWGAWSPGQNDDLGASLTLFT